MSSSQPHTSVGTYGTDFHLFGHGYSAIVTGRGASLRSLEYEGRPLIVGYGEDAPMPAYRGAVVAPWPNRLADGKYSFRGTQYQVDVNEQERGTALHGLVSFEPFQLVSHTASSVTLRRYLGDPERYPFDVYLTVTYTLKADGVHTTFAARNAGVMDAPYGACPHPYLVAGPSPMDTWVFSLPASRVLLTDERLLPTGLVSVFDDATYDFQPDAEGAAREISSTFLDHAYTGVNFDGSRQATATVWDPQNHCGTSLTWDVACPWVQVHTADTDDENTTRLGLAVEPMTCPPDAFNSGQDLVVLAPDASHTLWFKISALA